MVKYIKKLVEKFFRKKDMSNKNFFEFTLEEKKEIVKKATRGANKMQREAVEKYREKYGNIDPCTFTAYS